jgi:hypothetical protein
MGGNVTAISDLRSPGAKTVRVHGINSLSQVFRVENVTFTITNGSVPISRPIPRPKACLHTRPSNPLGAAGAAATTNTTTGTSARTATTCNRTTSIASGATVTTTARPTIASLYSIRSK